MFNEKKKNTLLISVVNNMIIIKHYEIKVIHISIRIIHMFFNENTTICVRTICMWVVRDR